VAVVNNESRASHGPIKPGPLVRAPFSLTETVPNFLCQRGRERNLERTEQHIFFFHRPVSVSVAVVLFWGGFSDLFFRNGGSVCSWLDSVFRSESLRALQPRLRRREPASRFSAEAGEQNRVIGNRDHLH